MLLRTIVSTVAGLAAAGGIAVFSTGLHPGADVFAAATPDDTFTVIPPGQVVYYTTEESLMNGRPVAPPQRTQTFEQPLTIMKRQVSQAEYAQCVLEQACRPLDRTSRGDVSPDLPVVGVSWEDATLYARWYSGHTGRHYRLPTYAEWVHAAGEAFTEDLRLDIYDSDNPAQRWLADYALETQRKVSADPRPKPFGSFGTNEAGVHDGGNVWDWTNTCHVRNYLDENGQPALPPTENCGVRVAAGSHPSLITDFIRDPKSGACSVGIPPSSVGIRLVLDQTS